MWRKGNCPALLVAMQISATTVESSMELPQKIKNGTALSLSDFTSGNIYRETLNTHLKKYMHAYVHCSLVYNSQDLETAQVFIIA